MRDLKIIIFLINKRNSDSRPTEIIIVGKSAVDQVI